MGYGLKITGPNEQFIIDSSIGGAQHLAIVSGPYSSTQSNLAYEEAYTDFQAGDLVFAKPADGAGKIFENFSNPSAPKNSGRNTSYHGEDQTYFIIRPSANSGHSLNQNSSTFGLRVLDTDGSTVMYDSRQTSKNINIVAVKGSLQCVGGGTGTSGNDTESSNVIYGSKTSNTYACMNPSHTYANTISGVTVEGFRGFDFEGTNVRYVGWSRNYYTFFQGGGTTFSIRNIAELIVGDLVQ